ncbi:MAG: MBL fold metallo-hydrolase [Spirochaetaceae bacterium]
MSNSELQTGRVLYDQDDHKVIWLGWGEDDDKGAVQTNQYLIVHNGKGVLLDPGGVHLFSRVVAVISNYINLDNIESIFFSHQDPDVSSGIALWLGVTRADIYISELWLRFVPHFGIIDHSRLKGIPDEGSTLPLREGGELQIIPAHFLHSPGNFALWDEKAQIVFSGDIGAAVFSRENRILFVEDFDQHLSLMEGFHKRYMTSNKLCKRFVHKVRESAGGKTITMIAPQHGGIFQDEKVERFLSWFEKLKCGADIIDEIG